jgi:hypothetical protein
MVIKRRRTPSRESISLPPTIAYLMPNLVTFAGDLVTGNAGFGSVVADYTYRQMERSRMFELEKTASCLGLHSNQ